MVETLILIYWTTIFGHRNGSGGYRIYTGVPGVTGTPRGLLGLMGPKWWKRRGSRRWRAAPLAPIRIGKGEGARPPFSVLLSTSSFPFS